MEADLSSTPALPSATVTATTPRIPSKHDQIEINFCLLDDETNFFADPFDAHSDDKIMSASEEKDDDLLASYIVTDYLGKEFDDQDPSTGGGASTTGAGAHGNSQTGKGESTFDAPKLRHSHSVDCLKLSAVQQKMIEAKKAMAPEKLAELWIVDPKRAKRILANRQSAARSKERKARYILELEKRVQCLQTERDTASLSTENTELRRQLESIEQQAQLRDALNEALEQELERLKFATGEAGTPTDPYIIRVEHVPFKSPFLHHPQPAHVDPQKLKLPHLHPLEPNMSNNPPYQADLPKSKTSHFYPLVTNILDEANVPRAKKPRFSGFGSDITTTCEPLDSSKTNLPQFCPLEMNAINCPMPLHPPNEPIPQVCSLETNMSNPYPSPLDPAQVKASPYPVDSTISSSCQPFYCPTISSHVFIQPPQDDYHLSRLPIFDASGKSSHLVKMEGPAIIASEGAGAF
ncbi:hypothetical protein Ancab_006076 [Ancistrocladus abbreviatus]